MRIGFDAKRAFFNTSGLGNYSRSLLLSLTRKYPDHSYYLFTPGGPGLPFKAIEGSGADIQIIRPEGLLNQKLSFRWRSYGITALLKKHDIDIFHGLSNELPLNIGSFSGKKIVTIHDLIFLKHPELYPFIDRTVYNRKVRSSCEKADHIIAVSEQTRNDIMEHYHISEDKIRVIYQSCSDTYRLPATPEQMHRICQKYGLPEQFLLYVGTIEKRKNLLNLVKALSGIPDIKLVVVGKKKAYFRKVQDFILSNRMAERVLFPDNVSSEELPTFYRMATAFIYPSLYEGFGIPVLEALTSGTPVITTRGGCFHEAGGDGSLYIDPSQPDEIAEAIKKVLSSSATRKEMSEKGQTHALRFLPEHLADQLMNLYTS